jgi:hypothetical protein
MQHLNVIHICVSSILVIPGLFLPRKVKESISLVVKPMKWIPVIIIWLWLATGYYGGDLVLPILWEYHVWIVFGTRIMRIQLRDKFKTTCIRIWCLMWKLSHCPMAIYTITELQQRKLVLPTVSCIFIPTIQHQQDVLQCYLWTFFETNFMHFKLLYKTLQFSYLFAYVGYALMVVPSSKS